MDPYWSVLDGISKQKINTLVHYRVGKGGQMARRLKIRQYDDGY